MADNNWQHRHSWMIDWSSLQASNNHMLVSSNDVSLGLSHRKMMSRVMKPSSAGTSPHSRIRRRTITSPSPTHYQRLIAQGNSPYPIESALLAASLHQQRQTRPVSWHPSSRHTATIAQNTAFRNTWGPVMPDHQQSTETYGTAAIYGLVTPVPYPVTADSISNEYFTPLDNSNCGISMMPQQAPFTPSETTSAMQLDTTGWNCDMLAPNLMTTDLSDPFWIPDALPMESPLSFDHTSMNFVRQSSSDLTAPPTPDILPIQQFQVDENPDEAPDISTRASADDLVGMGLYDAPEEVALSSGRVGGMNESLFNSGKGLKLEETFSPAPPPEEDEDAEGEGEVVEEEEEEGEEEEGGDDGRENEGGDSKELGNLPQQSTGPKVQDVKPDSLQGQSFFFDEDDDNDYE